ncbi:aspartate/glutamate racemase family protein [Candidatus Woesebacteria bacterium]|nr:aspartate/glutamate racemase family protein [Candidatus Woesebacteria bacterium]
MLKSPLIVFDSGIGGFSILKELLQYDVPILYYADQAHFPYGDKSIDYLNNRFVELAKLFKSMQPLALVVACNSGTVTALPYLRSQLSVPVFGVEPVTKMLKDHINPVVWGTKVTTSSDVAKELRLTHGEHIRYYTPVGLASAIEHDETNKIKSILDSAKEELNQIDAIGLSCTHYPLIKDMIQAYFPSVTIYDPSSAVAAHVARSLKLSARAATKPSLVEYNSSASVLRLQELSKRFGL